MIFCDLTSLNIQGLLFQITIHPLSTDGAIVIWVFIMINHNVSQLIMTNRHPIVRSSACTKEFVTFVQMESFFFSF